MTEPNVTESVLREQQHNQHTCEHIDYEPIRFGVETGVMIGGSSRCRRNAEFGSNFCDKHSTQKQKDGE